MYVCIYYIYYIYIYIMCIYIYREREIYMYTHSTYYVVFGPWRKTRLECMWMGLLIRCYIIKLVYCYITVLPCYYVTVTRYCYNIRLHYRIILLLHGCTPGLPTKSLDGFDSSRLLILRGGNSHVCRI